MKRIILITIAVLAFTNAQNIVTNAPKNLEGTCSSSCRTCTSTSYDCTGCYAGKYLDQNLHRCNSCSNCSGTCEEKGCSKCNFSYKRQFDSISRYWKCKYDSSGDAKAAAGFFAGAFFLVVFVYFGIPILIIVSIICCICCCIKASQGSQQVVVTQHHPQQNTSFGYQPAPQQHVHQAYQ